MDGVLLGSFWGGWLGLRSLVIFFSCLGLLFGRVFIVLYAGLVTLSTNVSTLTIITVSPTIVWSRTNHHAILIQFVPKIN